MVWLLAACLTMGGCASTAPSRGLQELIRPDPVDRVCKPPDAELPVGYEALIVAWANQLAQYRRCRESYEDLVRDFETLSRRIRAGW